LSRFWVVDGARLSRSTSSREASPALGSIIGQEIVIDGGPGFGVAD
jgi:hypothetical protein